MLGGTVRTRVDAGARIFLILIFRGILERLSVRTLSIMSKLSIKQQLVIAASKEVLNEFVMLFEKHESTLSEEHKVDIIKSIAQYVSLSLSLSYVSSLFTCVSPDKAFQRAIDALSLDLALFIVRIHADDMSQEDMWCILQDAHDDHDEAFHTMLKNFPIPISFFDDCDACNALYGEPTPKRLKTQVTMETKEEEDDTHITSPSSLSSPSSPDEGEE